MIVLGVIVAILGLLLSLFGWKKHSEIAWTEGWLIAAMGLVTCFIPKQVFIAKIVQLLLS